MNSVELYEATRGVWLLGVRRTEAKYAMAVAGGVVQEVYRIESWHPAGTTPYATRQVADETDLTKRWEFQGEIAEPSVREGYIGLDVSGLFPRGAANPATYAGF